VPKDTEAIGGPEASALSCALCGRMRFPSVDAFALHAALCFGPGTAPDDEEEEQEGGDVAGAGPAAAGASSAGEVAGLAAAPVLAAPDLVPTPAPASVPAPAAASALASNGSVVTASGLVLPGGIRAKLNSLTAGEAATAAPVDSLSDDFTAGADAEVAPSPVGPVSHSRGNTAAKDTAISGPFLPPDKADALLEGYQTGASDEEIDLQLLLALTAHIVQTSLAAAEVAGRRIGRSHTPEPSHTAGSHLAHGGARTPLDAGLGAVLIFLPGWEEISGAMELMRGHPVLGNPSRVVLLPLHSAIPTSEQRRVFRRPPAGVVKVVLSTNIAETSLTIDDVVYVVDAGRTKEKAYDAYTGCSSLSSVWVSQASARQRAGRAGRVRPGIAYHLFSRKRHAAMGEFAVPEMLRTPLDELCLQIKLLQVNTDILGADGEAAAAPPAAPAADGAGSGDVDAAAAAAEAAVDSVQRFLMRAVQPPPAHAIRSALQLLRDIGALAPRLTDAAEAYLRASAAQAAAAALPAASAGGRADAGKTAVLPPGPLLEDDLTPLGFRLAQLPASPRFGKMILQAILFRCLDPVLSIAAALSYRPPWVLPMHPSERKFADAARLRLSRGHRSDHMALLFAYQGFHAARAAGGGAPGNGREAAFCRENYLSPAALNMVTAMREQLLKELIACGALARLAGGDAGAAGDGSVDASGTAGSGSGRGGRGGRGLKRNANAVSDREAATLLARASANGGNTALVMSVLASGLFPSVGRVNPYGGAGGRRHDDDDEEGGEAGSFAAGTGARSAAELASRPGVQSRGNRSSGVHPSSVASIAIAGPGDLAAGARRPAAGGLTGQSATRSEWLAYDEMTMRGSFGAVALRGVSVVPPLALLLLCGPGRDYVATVLRRAATDDEAGEEEGEEVEEEEQAAGEGAATDGAAPLLGASKGASKGGKVDRFRAEHASNSAATSAAAAVAKRLHAVSRFEAALARLAAELLGAADGDSGFGSALAAGSGSSGDGGAAGGASLPAEALLEALSAVSAEWAAARPGGSSAGDEDEEDGAPAGASETAEVHVDDWIAFALPALQALALVVVRNRLHLAFHRCVVIPEAATALAIAPHGPPAQLAAGSHGHSHDGASHGGSHGHHSHHPSHGGGHRHHASHGGGGSGHRRGAGGASASVPACAVAAAYPRSAEALAAQQAEDEAVVQLVAALVTQEQTGSLAALAAPLLSTAPAAASGGFSRGGGYTQGSYRSGSAAGGGGGGGGPGPAWTAGPGPAYGSAGRSGGSGGGGGRGGGGRGRGGGGAAAGPGAPIVPTALLSRSGSSAGGPAGGPGPAPAAGGLRGGRGGASGSGGGRRGSKSSGGVGSGGAAAAGVPQGYQQAFVSPPQVPAAHYPASAGGAAQTPQTSWQLPGAAAVTDSPIAALLLRAASTASASSAGGGGGAGAAAAACTAPAGAATPPAPPTAGAAGQGGGGGRRGGSGGGGRGRRGPLLTPAALMAAQRR
jgi:hypothetical protein